MDIKNVVMLVGRLVADPELRYTPSGSPVINFAVAVNRSVKKADGSFGDDTLDGFFDCEVFGGQAIALAEGAKKGTDVHVTGHLLQKKFQTKGAEPRTVSKIEIRVSQLALGLAIPKKAGSQPEAKSDDSAEQSELTPA